MQLDDQLLKAALLPSVAPGGVFCSVYAILPTPDATAFAVAVKPDGPVLTSLLRRASVRELTTRIAGTVSMERAGDTLQSAFAGGVRGRWIVQPSSGPQRPTRLQRTCRTTESLPAAAVLGNN
jgi:hypothetical protein